MAILYLRYSNTRLLVVSLATEEVLAQEQADATFTKCERKPQSQLVKVRKCLNFTPNHRSGRYRWRVDVLGHVSSLYVPLRLYKIALWA